MFVVVNFFIWLLYFDQLDAESEDHEYRHEIICTGNTVQINLQCFSTLKMAHNLVCAVVVRTLVVPFLLVIMKCPCTTCCTF